MAKHINSTVSKCHGLLGVLRRASSYLTRDLLKLAYVSLIRSHLEYASVLFAGAAPTHLHKLDVIQKVASRIITDSDSRAHSSPLQLLLGLEPLEERRRMRILSITDDIKERKIHPFFQSYLEVNEASYSGSSVGRNVLEKKLFKNLSSKVIADQVQNCITNPCEQIREHESMLLGRQLLMSSSYSSISITGTIETSQPQLAPVTAALLEHRV